MDENTNGVPGEGACDAYTLAFSVGPAQRVVFGRVTAGACAGVGGVTVTAEPGAASATTDTNGNYMMSLPTDWSGTITPFRPGWAFVPCSVSANGKGNLRADFTLAGSPLSALRTNSTLHLEWASASGVTNWVESSESLTNWTDCAGPFAGTNGLLWFETNLTSGPQRFFRVRTDF